MKTLSFSIRISACCVLLIGVISHPVFAQIPNIPLWLSPQRTEYQDAFLKSANTELAAEAPGIYLHIKEETEAKLQSLPYYFLYGKMQDLSFGLAGVMEHAKEKGKAAGFDIGEKDGFLRELKALRRQAILQKMEQGEHCEAGYICIPALQAANIELSLASVNGRPCWRELQAFSEALRATNEPALQALNTSLGLNPREVQYVMERYDEIHAPLARLLYVKYLQLLKTQAPGYQHNYYTFPHYNAVEKFCFLVRSNFPSLLDAVYTYLWEDCGFTAERGFKGLGTMQRLTQEVLIPLLEDQLYQAAIIQDYDANLARMTQTARRIFYPLTIETRTEIRQAQGTVRLGSSYVADVSMDIKTILRLRFDVSRLKITVDHDNQIFQVYVPDDPRLLEVVMQDYIVRNMEMRVNDPCGPLPSIVKFKPLPHFKLEHIFKKNRPKIKSLAIYKRPFDHDTAAKILLPQLKKLLEPSLSLFHSHYKAVLILGNSTYTII